MYNSVRPLLWNFQSPENQAEGFQRPEDTLESELGLAGETEGHRVRTPGRQNLLEILRGVP